MSSMGEPDTRLQELAAGYAIGDLSDAELLEIKAYDEKSFGAMVERSEEAAANAFLTFQKTAPVEPIPTDLSLRLKNMAEGFSNKPTESDLLRVANPKLEHATYIRRREIAAWLCVAASVAFALMVWIPSRTSIRYSATARRDILIANASDLIRTRWESTNQELVQGKELGDVVWSSASQEGFMKIRGLPVNDRSKEQYQLWIIDPSRDEKPVDGGVFDITSTEDAIVPIHAKLRVDKPAVFAVTIEKPGGVVVSDQKRLPLIAKVP
jgi:anti-sigma-K factor RskA